MRLLAVGLLMLLSVEVAPRANAQGAARAAATLTYQPGIDVLDYDVALELPDTGTFLRGDVTVTLRRSAGVSRLVLDLADALAVRSVTVQGERVTAPHAANRLEIPLAGGGDSLRVRVTYDGSVRDGLVVRRDKQGRWTWFGDNWPDRARQWLPTVDHPSDKATVTWTVTAPPSRTVVANGEQTGTRRLTVRGVGMRETRWRESRPIATYLMVIAAGQLVRFDLREPDCHYGDLGQCVRQTIYVMPEHRRWLPGPFLAAGPILSLFERMIGPFPYEKLAHLQSSTRFGGMENASAIFYADNLFASRTLSDGLIAHEMAHQWFGNAVTAREWSHLWLSEGFATYLAALWTQFVRGDNAYRTELATIRRQVMSDSIVATRPVIDTAQTDYLALLNTNSYQKGAYVLYMLHQQLGDSAFFAGVRMYYATYRHGTALTDDLRREFEKSSRQSLSQFFSQWLRRSGVAQPSIGWAYDPSTASVTVAVLQEGRVPPYSLALPVTITDATGAVTRVTIAVPAEPRATLALPGRFNARPRSVRFDPDEQMLARIIPL